MKHLAALYPLLLLALACNPVHGVWTFDENINYFTRATDQVYSKLEATAGSQIDAQATRPAKTTPDRLQGFPEVPGALCSKEKLTAIGNAWNTAIKFANVAEQRHELQMQKEGFRANAAFLNFVASENYMVLGAPDEGPGTLYEVLSKMFANMKVAFGEPPPLKGGKGRGLYVTCYDYYWARDDPEHEYSDSCVNANAFVEQVTFTTATGGTIELEFMNFCPLFFTHNKPWPGVVDDIATRRTRQAAVDYARDSQVTVLLHEWSHITGMMWKSSEDIAYGAKDCRKLTKVHGDWTERRGLGLYSARHTPGNADSEALYMMSLAMDAEPRINVLYGNARNVNRLSAAEPDSYAEVMDTSLPDNELYDASIEFWSLHWALEKWPASSPGGSDRNSFGGSFLGSSGGSRRASFSGGSASGSPMPFVAPPPLRRRPSLPNLAIGSPLSHSGESSGSRSPVQPPALFGGRTGFPGRAVASRPSSSGGGSSSGSPVAEVAPLFGGRTGFPGRAVASRPSSSGGGSSSGSPVAEVAPLFGGRTDFRGPTVATSRSPSVRSGTSGSPVAEVPPLRFGG